MKARTMRLPAISTKLELPIQSPPVSRHLLANQHRWTTSSGITSAQADACADLTGLAQQMCYATYYGVSM